MTNSSVQQHHINHQVANNFMFAGFAVLLIQVLALAIMNSLSGAYSKALIFGIHLSLSTLTIVLFSVSMLFHHRACKNETSTKHKVIGWTLYDKDQKRWEDAHEGESNEKEWADVEQSIINEVRKNGYKFGGYYHQYGSTGCPVMEDGTVVMFSMRAWGDLMSRVWGGAYTDYAWEGECGEGFKIPPTFANADTEVLWLTEEEMSARDIANAEAQKMVAQQQEKREKEYQAQKAKEHRQNVLFSNKFISKFLQERGVVVDVKTAHEIAALLLKTFEECKTNCAPSLKWIFDPAERHRVENARKREMQKAEKEFQKMMDEQTVDSNK